MRYAMREKIFSWGDDYVIRDADGEHRYLVDGRAFSIGNKLSFQDLEGNELAFIRQRLLEWGPTYEIERGGKIAATVKKALFTLFSCKFHVDVPGPDDLVAAGDFLHHEYDFKRRGLSVARVSKAWFSWSDTYGIDVVEGEDDVLILASSVVIDLACHPDD